MTATNHVITGALIGSVVANPLFALPLALASHVAVDALPHYGGGKAAHDSRLFFFILGSDAFVGGVILLAILIMQPANWPLMLACGILAASPDLLWLPEWINELRGKPNRKRSGLLYFLGWVQWGERPWGWIFELIWFFGGLYFLLPILTT